MKVEGTASKPLINLAKNEKIDQFGQKRRDSQFL